MDITNEKVMRLPKLMSWDNFEVFLVCLGPCIEKRKENDRLQSAPHWTTFYQIAELSWLGATGWTWVFWHKPIRKKVGFPSNLHMRLDSSAQKRILFATVVRLSEIGKSVNIIVLQIVPVKLSFKTLCLLLSHSEPGMGKSSHCCTAHCRNTGWPIHGVLFSKLKCILYQFIN